MASWTSAFTGVVNVPAGPMLLSAVSLTSEFPAPEVSVCHQINGRHLRLSQGLGGSGFTGRGGSSQSMHELICLMYLSWDLSKGTDAVLPQ